MTPQSANAALKFFEEPGFGNIIILTNASQADILETILSRVQIVRLTDTTTATLGQYDDMVSRYFSNTDTDLVSFLFTQKLEKSQYQSLLFSIFQALSQK